MEGQLNARLQDTRIHGELIFGRELAFSGPLLPCPVMVLDKESKSRINYLGLLYALENQLDFRGKAF